MLILPRPPTWIGVAVFLIVASVAAGCSRDEPKAPVEAPQEAATPASGTEAPEIPSPTSETEIPLSEGPPEFEAALPEDIRALLTAPFTGDFDQMVQRRLICVGVTYNRTFYFAEKGVQRGVCAEFAKALEDWLNEKLETGNAKINVALMAMPRDQLAQALLGGKVDFVMAQVTVRPELQKLVDFTNDTRTNVSEVVVTGPGVPAIVSVDDLSGQEVFARKYSNF